MIDNDGLSLSDYYRKNKLKEIVDPSIKQQMSLDSVTRYLEKAYGCPLACIKIEDNDIQWIVL